jgi:hypothetical protein
MNPTQQVSKVHVPTFVAVVIAALIIIFLYHLAFGKKR